MRGSEEDRTLVKRCIHGEDAAWKEFVERFTPWMEAVIRRTLRRHGVYPHDGDVEEIAWKTYGFLFRQRYRYLSQFRWDCPLELWLARIAGTQTVGWLRSRPIEKIPFLPFPTAEEGAGDPLDEKVSQERIERVREALARLPDREREILEAVYYRDASYRDIARRWNAPLNTVASWISRAKDRLITLLDDLRLPLL